MVNLAELNTPQRKAAETIKGPVLILAGAGSGKTRTITFRIAHMVHNLGIPAEQILGVSFTNKAAGEMRERVKGLLGRKKASHLTLSTFHSLGIKILKKEIVKLGYHKNFSIYDTSDQMSIVREGLNSFRAEKKAFDRKQILSKIGFLKNKGVSEDDFVDSPFFDCEDAYDHATEYIYRYYQDKLRFFNAIDFDDILFLVVKLFGQHPEIAEAYSKQFKYVMVDEYQDTNPLQFSMIMGLTTTHDNLCVVGDDDQSIYSFRGADISNILNFEKNYPTATVVKLEENYRSTTPILNLANKVIVENKERREKTLWSQIASTQPPLVWAAGDTEHEAQIVVEEVVSHQGKGKMLSDIAVLYRSNTQAPAIEEQLRLSQVPSRVLGGQKFYDKKEVKDLMAYLTTILNPGSQVSLRRILNVPNRGIGTATLGKYLTKSDEIQQSLFETMKRYNALDPKRAVKIQTFTQLIQKYMGLFRSAPLAPTIEKLIDELDYLNYIDKQHDNIKQAAARKKDVQMFVEAAARFSRQVGSKATLKNFVEKILLQDSQDEKDKDDDDEQENLNSVTLMTLHSSKGLEFKKVFMVGIEEELLPHKRTISAGEDMSEERRLCYVGITRAQESLIMTYCKERTLFGRKAPRHKSRFINELSANYTEQDRTQFGHLSEDEAVAYKKNFFDSLIDSLDD